MRLSPCILTALFVLLSLIAQAAPTPTPSPVLPSLFKSSTVAKNTNTNPSKAPTSQSEPLVAKRVFYHLRVNGDGSRARNHIESFLNNAKPRWEKLVKSLEKDWRMPKLAKQSKDMFEKAGNLLSEWAQTHRRFIKRDPVIPIDDWERLADELIKKGAATGITAKEYYWGIAKNAVQKH